MSNQTALNGADNLPSKYQTHERGSTRAFVGTAADVVHDVVDLVELQAKLLAADTATVRRKVVTPTIIMITALCVLLGTIPIALMGLAEVFVVYAEMEQYLAYLAAGGCGLLLAFFLLIVGWWRVKNGFQEFDNTKKELQRNVAWIKYRLRGGNTTPVTSR